MTDSIQALRDDILRAALPHVPFDGWSTTALRRGAEDSGHAVADALRAFPGGVADAIEHHSRYADRRMMEELERRDLAAMKIRDRIATAVRVRLEQNAGDREAIRRAVGYLALPQNALLSTRLLYHTVDAMWYAAGDTATDWNFYSKRALLAAVYSSTLLYWLNDRSEGFADTWGFLDRRIADVMRIPRATARLQDAFRYVPNPFRLFRRPRRL